MGHMLSCLYPRQHGGLPSDTMANPKNESCVGKLWNVFEKCKLASQESSRRLIEEVSEPSLIRHWTQENFRLESVKLGRPMDESATRRTGLIFGRGVENWHVGQFGVIGRARRTSRRFAKTPPYSL
uniref:Uncharacterized protein n=1 Tax=Solanum tuberosum TaxID=4113 RepID=M1DBP4_SOLTU